MRVDVLSCDVGDVALKAIAFPVEYNAGFQAMLDAAVFLGPEKYAKLERHVEPEKGRLAVDLCARDVMDAVAAFPNDLADFVEAIIRRIICFKRAPWCKPGANDRENGSVEERLIAIVDGQLTNTSRFESAI
jgi:hypothetical protein